MHARARARACVCTVYIYIYIYLFQLNSLQINRPTSGETKTKCSLDLKYFSFTPRKSIQHSTSNLSTFDSNIRKTNNELNNSNLSKKPVACSQQHRSGDVSEDKDSNFVDIDDLLKSNFTERTLVPKTKKLTCLPASNVYIPVSYTHLDVYKRQILYCAN